MQAREIRDRYLKFFESKGHKIVPSASLVPENDPTTLFTGSGMQPMVPYLLGETHPLGNRITDSQKSFRTGDIEEVGDNRHTTFFEMLGNWSFGDYFKAEQLPWVFELITKEYGLDPKKIYVTTFSGDTENGLNSDSGAVAIWQNLFKQVGIEAKTVVLETEEKGAELGMQGGRIFAYREKNWWSRAGAPAKMPAGEPGGADSELFYEFDFVKHDLKFGKNCHPNCDCGRYIEIGNSVFMEFKKVADKKFEPLVKKNIDFGGGLERIAMAVQNTNDIFKIDIFADLIKQIETLSGTKYDDVKFTTAYRVIADHLRASIFLIGDGVLPSNSDQGYFVRRLLRRAVRYADILNLGEGKLADLVEPILSYYKEAYPETFAKLSFIKDEIKAEEEKFRKALSEGLKIIERNVTKETTFLNQDFFFDLYQNYGFPFEVALEEVNKRRVAFGKEKVPADIKEHFTVLFKNHQALSRAGSEQKFKGGLGGTGEKEVRYHTATHLLHQALRDVLGTGVQQKGSNITAERLRFDFAHGAKMTDEEKKKVEDIVNSKIKAALPVNKVILPKAEAEKTGALHFFGDKYGDQVSVYFIGNDLNSAYSKEFCGGPHVSNTSELGTFKIAKEEAVSAGVRRIKAVLN